MSRKLGFIVVSSSSHEDNFSAQELMVHAPTVNGWRSCRLCSYPQHITFQLEKKSRMKKLQLLAHQYLIPAKVEFHVGDFLPEVGTTELRRLGYVTLSDNEKTDFKARELKSVHVDAVGTYLRLTFYRNFPNQLNHYDQVALVAFNILGDSLDEEICNTIPSQEQLIEHYLNSTQPEAALETTFLGKCDSISPLDDLAFDMYQDPEVARIIRLLDQNRQNMVSQKKYDEVKIIKQAMADLQKVGERLARYDVEKKCAIEKEDFDLAKTMKEQMEAYRKSVYRQLEEHNLLDLELIKRAADPSSALTKCSPSCPPAFVVGHDVSRKTKSSVAPQNQMLNNVLPKNDKEPIRCENLSAGDGVSVPSDQPPHTALQRKEEPSPGVQIPPMESSPQVDVRNSLTSPDLTGELELLTEKSHREASLAIQIYGEVLVAGVYSKIWSNREEALLAVHNKLLEVPNVSSKEKNRDTIRAAVFLVKKTLLDKVSSVFQNSLNLLWLILNDLIPNLGLGRAEVVHCFEQTWTNLLARTGDSAPRNRLKASALIQKIALLKDVRNLQVVPVELVIPFKSNFPARLARSRVELVEKLLLELGTENSGFTLDNVMKFSTAALEHSAAPVREMAVRIILSMYNKYKCAVVRYLPPDNSAMRKNFLYKSLFDGFAKIDGKKAAKRGGERQKQEIQSLQEQLAALKLITERSSESTKEHKAKDEDQKVKVEKESQKAVSAKVTSSQSKKTTSTHQQSTSYLDNLCIFCGKKDSSFTEDGLDLHYWKHCPMLRRCDECRQVVEIASLTEHLLGECDSRSKFSQCPRCSEAVTTDSLSRHVQGPSCNPSSSGKDSNHCPLCHNNFMSGEEAWKAHLMGGEGCKHNSRRTAVSQRSQSTQAKAADPPKPKQSWPVGTRGRARQSRIPALTPQARGPTPGQP
ncbi:centrosomal protein of 104 kDa [Synchiropus splendidus]|uniref:centrosomal protein of 104 kDa n=1 Tax=Synchiropus splendidus TaxID=270530 RepID=UPI00237DC653|nr:centrosomal protein of 104 kDa [Synchiropus splendidus]XP_053705944.1 centrosomal protein of 104 kDa [Synchiropus splendidus]XP_053705945.1 centrosomal protein of 104 kDa [Synchiropus splendidus]XP_053705946.1 centrosomal protein of 104 kDa [Synchiropus splendidus]